jgi:hypothetical protein
MSRDIFAEELADAVDGGRAVEVRVLWSVMEVGERAGWLLLNGEREAELRRLLAEAEAARTRDADGNYGYEGL